MHLRAKAYANMDNLQRRPWIGTAAQGITVRRGVETLSNEQKSMLRNGWYFEFVSFLFLSRLVVPDW